MTTPNHLLTKFRTAFDSSSAAWHNNKPFDLNDSTYQNTTLIIKGLMVYLLFYDLNLSYGKKAINVVNGYLNYGSTHQFVHKGHTDDDVMMSLLKLKQSINPGYVYKIEDDELENDTVLKPVTNQQVVNLIEMELDTINDEISNQSNPKQYSDTTANVINLLHNVYDYKSNTKFQYVYSLKSVLVDEYHAIEPILGTSDDVRTALLNDLHEAATANDEPLDWDDPDSPSDFMGYNDDDLTTMDDLIHAIFKLEHHKDDYFYTRDDTGNYNLNPMTIKEVFTTLTTLVPTGY